jgi:[acyl-carrier-protein] S-malonyltransferase
VQEMCRQTDTEVANLNCPGQVVVSGAVTGIAQIEALAKAAGAKRVMRLDVGGAFHSALMEPARHSMERALQRVQIQSLTCPVVCNVTAQPTTNPAQLRANLVAQLTRPTLWIDSMRALIGQGITQFIELAPAKVLAGLQKRIDPSAHTQPINTPEDLHVLSTISP